MHLRLMGSATTQFTDNKDYLVQKKRPGNYCRAFLSRADWEAPNYTVSRSSLPLLLLNLSIGTPILSTMVSSKFAIGVLSA